jgi:hypothetical protein
VSSKTRESEPAALALHPILLVLVILLLLETPKPEQEQDHEHEQDVSHPNGRWFTGWDLSTSAARRKWGGWGPS